MRGGFFGGRKAWVLRLQGSECATLQGSLEVGRLGSLRLQGSVCVRLPGFFGGWKAGFSEAARQ